MFVAKTKLLAVLTLPLVTLAACGGAGGGSSIGSTPAPPTAVPAPPPSPAAAPAPAPAPVINFDTTEYRRSGAAVQAQALAAYTAGATGAGVLVGVIDSGVDTSSAEFSGRISPLSTDFAGTRGLRDEGGHGTAVSGVLLGSRNDSGIHGVAFAATLLALRTDTPGSCASGSSGTDSCTHSDTAIASALDAAVAARAKVVNISLGGTSPNARLRGAIDRATDAGTIIVIAAGNVGVTDPAAAVSPDVLAQIANDPAARGLVIIAGASEANGALADFSNRAGNSAASYLTALGVRVRSVDHQGTAMLFSGTSFSTPVISGAVALIAQAFPSLTPAQIVSLLYRSADDRGTAGVDSVYGRGELNLARAFGPVGALSLGNSAIPVSLGTNATLGSAMGDAAQGSLGVAIRDEYGRDFAVDLAPTVARSPVQRTLANGLGLTARNMAAAGGRTSFALAIDDSNPMRPLQFTWRETERARVLAGSMAISVSKTLKIGFGGGRGADGLAPSPQDLDVPAFLVTDRSLDRAPVGAFAARQAFGDFGLTIAAERGDMRLWEQGELGPIADGVRRYAYSEVSAGLDGRVGSIGMTAKLTQLNENASILGSRFGAALGGNGATSRFADIGATLTPAAKWRVQATVRRGWTNIGGNSVRDRSMIATQGLSGMLMSDDIWVRGDGLAFRYVEPLRVSGGGFDLLGLGGAAQTLTLTPSGRERDLEAVYARPLGRGWLTANSYWRRQPGNLAQAPDDFGAAVRYAMNF